MKIFFTLIFFLFLGACTPDIALKNAALRHMIVQFDDQLAKMPDQAVAKQIKAKTKIEVLSLEKTSDTRAVVTLKVDTVSAESLSSSLSREEKVFFEKKNDWTVTESTIKKL